MTDLTDRMRTCAAWLLRAASDRAFADDVVRPVSDAAELLLEASNVIEGAPAPLGEPMAILAARPPTATPTSIDPPDKLVEQYKADRTPKAVWTTNAGDLPKVPTGTPSHRHPRVCPACGSRASKRVLRHENKVMLACPACAHAWEYRP